MNSIFMTHTGWVKQVNQDTGLIEQLDQETLLVIVADGMGGHKAGDVASQMATQIIKEEVLSHWNKESWEQLLSQAVEKANQCIYEKSKLNFDLDGMGTTVIVGLLSSRKGLIAHVGDSRVYLSSSSSFQQLTEDHSYVNALFKSGQITLEEAKNHPHKNMILRAVGTEEEIEVDIIPFVWDNGDRIIFCTDGFSNHIRIEQLNEYLTSQNSISELGEEMMQAALKIGGDDNITFVLVENFISSDHGGDGV